MADLQDIINFGLCISLMTLTAIGIVIAVFLPGIERWNRIFFTSLFASTTLCMVSSIVDLMIYQDINLITLDKIAVYSQYFLLSVPMPMFTMYLLHTCGESWKTSRLFRVALGIWIIFFILLGITQFTTFIYYIEPDGKFYRGEFHFLLMLPMILLLILNLCGVIRRRSKLTKKYYAAFLVHLLPIITTFMVHTFFYFPMLTLVGVVLSMLSMFAIILYEQIEQNLNQQREIYNQRTSIMVLQMRPHFIYNAMMSIYYLCAKDSKKAQQVTLDFVTYLRKNFTAIASENTVPFDDELEHTRAYLAIEQVQFEDNLLVEYDTPHKNFQLPPLTLQPIVENAVKHGMDPASAPLCIKIQTLKTNTGSEIIVEDNGTGFDFDADCEPHNTLANIRQRLKIMCGGKLEIQKIESGGTVVTVTIPN